MRKYCGAASLRRFRAPFSTAMAALDGQAPVRRSRAPYSSAMAARDDAVAPPSVPCTDSVRPWGKRFSLGFCNARTARVCRAAILPKSHSVYGALTMSSAGLTKCSISCGAHACQLTATTSRRQPVGNITDHELCTEPL